MRDNITASERRGIIVVALLALLITGSGWLVSTCQRSSADVTPAEVEVLVNGHGLDTDASDASNTKKSKRIRKDSVGGRKKSVKTFRRRSPRDEGV